MIRHEKAYYEEMRVTGLPLTNDGKTDARQVGAGGGFIPKGAKNVEVAKDFMRFFMQPQVMNENLKSGLGRWVPSSRRSSRTTRGGSDSKDPHRKPYVHRGRAGADHRRPTSGSIRPGARSTPSRSGASAMPMSSRTA